MSEFIFVGIIVILGVNGLYSRFCENVRRGTPQFSQRKTQSTAGRQLGIRF